MKFMFLLMLIAHQLVVADCSDLYGDISPLKMTLAEIEGKKEVFGHLIKNEKQLHEITQSIEPNVDIIYLINSNDDLIIGPRFELEANNKNALVAHISLYEKLKQLGLDHTIMASGEILRRNSQITALTNKSGTFRGNKANLKKAQRALVDLKLIDRETKLLDYSTNEVAGNHVGDVELANNYKEISESKEQSKLFKDIEEMYLEFSQLFPDDEVAGSVSIDKMAKFLMSKMDIDSIFMKIYKGITHIEYLQKDGLYRYSGVEELQQVRDEIAFSLQVLESN